VDDRLRRIIVPAAILLAGCALFVVYAYPGYMSYDSAWQLREARSGWLTDWHPPLMAEIVCSPVSSPLRCCRRRRCSSCRRP